MRKNSEPAEIVRYRQAGKSVRKARSIVVFLAHLGAFIFGNLFLGGWNVLTYYVGKSETLWFYLPLVFWGTAVIIHYIVGVALFDDWWEKDERNISRRRQG